MAQADGEDKEVHNRRGPGCPLPSGAVVPGQPLDPERLPPRRPFRVPPYLCPRGDQGASTVVCCAPQRGGGGRRARHQRPRNLAEVHGEGVGELRREAEKRPCLIVGDFNHSPAAVAWRLGKEVEDIGDVTFRHNFTGSPGSLDHCAAFGLSVASCWVVNDGFMMSDHLPLVIDIKRQTWRDGLYGQRAGANA